MSFTVDAEGRRHFRLDAEPGSLTAEMTPLGKVPDQALMESELSHGLGEAWAAFEKAAPHWKLLNLQLSLQPAGQPMPRVLAEIPTIFIADPDFAELVRETQEQEK